MYDKRKKCEWSVHKWRMKMYYSCELKVSVATLLTQADQTVLETLQPTVLPIMELPPISGSTRKENWLGNTSISSVQQIGYEWGWNCPVDSSITSRSLWSKRLSLESTSVWHGVQTQGRSYIHNNDFVFSGHNLCRLIQQLGQQQRQQQAQQQPHLITLIWTPT